ncbi:MAG: flagellar biosynthesis anti-sigma factor FlgM [Candidatus Solibacter sp.]
MELSGFTDRLSRAMQDVSASRVQRLNELSAAVRSGSYQVDAKAVSHAMVSQAISSGSSGKA